MAAANLSHAGPGRPCRAVRQGKGRAGGWEGFGMKRAPRGRGVRDVRLLFSKEIFLGKPSFKRTSDGISPHSKSSKPWRPRQRDLRGRALGRVQSNWPRGFSSWKSSWARRCSCAKGRRMVAAHRPANPCAATPTACWPWPKRPVRPCARSSRVGACAWAPWKARPQAPAPAAGAIRGPGPMWCWTLSTRTLPTTGGASRRPHARCRPWSPWPPPGLKPIRRVDPRCFKNRCHWRCPLHHPPVQSPADLIRRWPPSRGCTYRHRRSMDASARGISAPVLELASYRHHRLRGGGRCAGVVPRAVWDLMRRAPALRLVPCTSCDTVLVRKRLPVARAGCAAGRTARHTAAHRRLDFIA